MWVYYPQTTYGWVNTNCPFCINSIVACCHCTSTENLWGSYSTLNDMNFFCSDLISHSIIQSYFLQVIQTCKRRILSKSSESWYKDVNSHAFDTFPAQGSSSLILSISSLGISVRCKRATFNYTCSSCLKM